jgi:hypothetical protein
VWSAIRPNTGGAANIPVKVIVAPVPTAVAAFWIGTASAESVM